jgi:hypothetical protein
MFSFWEIRVVHLELRVVRDDPQVLDIRPGPGDCDSFAIVQRFVLAGDDAAVNQLCDARRHHLRVKAEVVLLVEGACARQVRPRLAHADLNCRAVGDKLAHVPGDDLRHLRRLR